MDLIKKLEEFTGQGRERSQCPCDILRVQVVALLPNVKLSKATSTICAQRGHTNPSGLGGLFLFAN